MNRQSKIITEIITLILAIGLLLLPSSTFAQEEVEEIEGVEDIEKSAEEIGKRMEEWGEEMEEWGEQLESAIESGEQAPSIPPVPSLPGYITATKTPKFDLYLEDVGFQDVYEKRYPYNYGVLVTGVIKGGNSDRAGIMKGDIIMEFDGEKVRFEDHLISMRNSKNIGDTVEIKVFRNEKEVTTQLTFNLPARKEKERDFFKGKGKLSPGYGGGGFEPIWIDYDFSGISDFLVRNGFERISKGGIIAWGGVGAGNVGKGWFIGGMGAGFEKTEQIRNDDGVTKKYVLSSGFGGVTVAKKFPVMTERLILDIGIMLGGGGTELELAETDGDFSWDVAVDATENRAVKFTKSYFVYRPSVGLLIRINDWLGIHGSVGYLETYAFDDNWTEKPFDFTVGGASPIVPSGLTYSLGVRFGY